MEKAESPSFLSMGPVPDSQRAPLSNLDPNQKSATLRSDGGRSFAGFTRLVFAGSPRAVWLWLESSWGSPNRRYFDSRIDAEVAVTMAHATGAKQNGLRDHSWEKRPSPRGRFRVLTAPRRSSCQRRDSRDTYIYIEADIDTLPEHLRRFAIMSMSRQQFSEATGAAARRAAPSAQNKKLLP
jgi:hypothetical protein